MTNLDELYHYGVGHDEDPPGRGSGRYPYNPVLHLDKVKADNKGASISDEIDKKLSKYNLKEQQYEDLRRSAIQAIEDDNSKAARVALRNIAKRKKAEIKRAQAKDRQDEADRRKMEDLKKQRDDIRKAFERDTANLDKDSEEYKGKEREYQSKQADISKRLSKEESKLSGRQKKYDSTEDRIKRDSERDDEMLKLKREQQEMLRVDSVLKDAKRLSDDNDAAEAKRRRDILEGKIPLNKLSLKELNDYNSRLNAIQGIERVTGNYKYSKKNDSTTFKVLKNEKLAKTVDTMSDFTKIASTTVGLLVALGIVTKSKNGKIEWANKKDKDKDRDRDRDRGRSGGDES